LPGRLWELPKKGFTAPIGEWIASPYAAMFREEVLRPQAAVSGLVDLREVERRFGEHQRGQTDHGYTLWALWVLERWFRQMSRDQQRVPRSA
jgi:asparagine synthase (glutamine-hydrolysing)